MAGAAKLAPHIVQLGEALQPALRKVEAELCKTVRPRRGGESFIAAAHGALACLGAVEDRLTKMLVVLNGVVGAADVPAVQVYRAAGRFEMVVDDLLECYVDLRHARPFPTHERGHELLVAAFRHTLTQIRGWLLDVVDTAADLMEVLNRKGLPTDGSVSLNLVLDMTPPKELKELTDWANALARKRRLWIGLAAGFAGIFLGLSLGGDD